MNKTTEALKLSTVALKDIACTSQTDDLLWWQIRAREALAAIREALAEPVKQELNWGANKFMPHEQPVKQEPVACIIHTEEGDYVDWNSKGYCFYIGETPLYAAPVRTKDLTEYELDELRFQNLNYLDYARAVIAKDREKNK